MKKSKNAMPAPPNKNLRVTLENLFDDKLTPEQQEWAKANKRRIAATRKLVALMFNYNNNVGAAIESFMSAWRFEEQRALVEKQSRTTFAVRLGKKKNKPRGKK